MKRIFAVALGILTAIGGFLDIGDIVTNAVVGSRFGWSLAWVVVVSLGLVVRDGLSTWVAGMVIFQPGRIRSGSVRCRPPGWLVERDALNSVG